MVATHVPLGRASSFTLGLEVEKLQYQSKLKSRMTAYNLNV